MRPPRTPRSESGDTAPPRPQKPVTTPESRDPRVAVHAGAVRYFHVVVMRRDTGERLEGIPVNLNAGGMFLHTETPFPSETPLELEGCAHDSRTEYRFRLRGWVVYRTDDGMGIQFDDPTPEAVYLIHHVVRLFLPEGHHLADPSW